MMQITEGVALSGKETSTGRNSGETINGAEGAISSIYRGTISQAKGQRRLVVHTFIKLAFSGVGLMVATSFCSLSRVICFALRCQISPSKMLMYLYTLRFWKFIFLVLLASNS